MALYSATAPIGGAAGMAVPTAAIGTLLELDIPAGRIAIVKQWWIEFDGTVATNAPVRVELITATAASTGGTALVTTSLQVGQPASASTAQTLPTAEGTLAATGVEEHRVPPTSGLLIQYPLGEEPRLLGGVGISYRIRALAGAAVNATAGIEWEE